MGLAGSLNPEAMETQPRRLPDGWCHALNTALLAATTVTGGALLLQLLDGRRKALVVHWCGDPEHLNDFLPYRGDGELTLVSDHPHLPIPPNLGAGGRRGWNIRAAVPLWLVHPTGGGLQVLGCGALHPLFNSATIDHFSPLTGAYVERNYLSDPRVKLGDPPPDFVPVREQIRRLWEMDGVLDAAVPAQAPVLLAQDLEPGGLGW